MNDQPRIGRVAKRPAIISQSQSIPLLNTAQPALLPKLHKNHSGIGGVIKSQPEDFRVEEVLAYIPSGEGTHLYLLIEKRDLAHDLLLRQLSQALSIPQQEIGYAGIKDKKAMTRQWVSVPESCEKKIEQFNSEAVQLLEVTRHPHKIKIGKVKANRFELVIRDCRDIEPAILTDWITEIRSKGFANYFGEQRFGQQGDNACRGHQILLQAIRKQQRVSKRIPKLRFVISALQSALFNLWLAQRISNGTSHQVIAGDVLQKTDTGGLFHAEADELAECQARLDRGEVMITGPIFGSKMKQPQEECGNMEQQLLESYGITQSDFRLLGKKALGARRPALVKPEELSADVSEDRSISLRFTLPSGCYATVLMGELMS